jgi:hypothetical protein
MSVRRQILPLQSESASFLGLVRTAGSGDTKFNSRFALYNLRSKLSAGGEKDYGHDDLRIGRSTPGGRR